MSKYVDNGLLMDKRDRLSSKRNAMRFLYNPDEKTVLGRTAKSWAQILLFYVIFYLVLSALFAFCMWVFFQTLDPRIPKWKLDGSLIGTNPGLGFRPMPDTGSVESTLIWYKGTDRENYKHWVKNLEEFLEVYRKPGLTPGRGQNIYNCDYDRPPGRGQVCNVDIRSWDPCTVENDFNYHKAAPCIFLKLNKVLGEMNEEGGHDFVGRLLRLPANGPVRESQHDFQMMWHWDLWDRAVQGMKEAKLLHLSGLKIYGWIPEYYNSTANLPESMPASLKNHIANVSITKSHELNTVWVTCEGENPADIENLGPLTYIPRQGFPGYFFPFENSEGYLSPIVAVHISNPRSGIIINIECKAWAKNIKHNRQDRLGSVHLELMID